MRNKVAACIAAVCECWIDAQNRFFFVASHFSRWTSMLLYVQMLKSLIWRQGTRNKTQKNLHTYYIVIALHLSSTMPTNHSHHHTISKYMLLHPFDATKNKRMQAENCIKRTKQTKTENNELCIETEKIMWDNWFKAVIHINIMYIDNYWVNTSMARAKNWMNDKKNDNKTWKKNRYWSNYDDSSFVDSCYYCCCYCCWCCFCLCTTVTIIAIV